MSWSNFDAGKCDVCSEWFHRKCERIPDIAFSPNADILNYYDGRFIERSFDTKKVRCNCEIYTGS